MATDFGGCTGGMNTGGRRGWDGMEIEKELGMNDV